MKKSEIQANTVHNMDCLEGMKTLPDSSVDCCVTSPPYFNMRDYGVAGQTGQEKTPEDYVARLLEVFAEVRRVLKPAGTLWLNIGDCYNGSGKNNGNTREIEWKQRTNAPSRATGRTFVNNLKPKDLIGIPWMLAFALRSAGWYLRQDIIWHKPSAMPESVTDRCTASHEYIFLLSKSAKYYFDYMAIAEKATRQGVYSPDGTRRKRDVWTVCAKPEPEAHFACFPQLLIADCIKAGCPAGGVVLDPFMGSGTTAVVARKLGRNYVGFELNPKYMEICRRKLNRELGIFS
jgi:DNA modification methylase